MIPDNKKKYNVKIVVLSRTKEFGEEQALVIEGTVTTKLDEHDLAGHLFAMEFKINGSLESGIPNQRVHISLETLLPV